ncbi:hypothetical protein Tco_0007560 [Tanacetum coccineum]
MGAMDKALYSFIKETSGKRWNEVEAGLGDAVQGKTSETGCLECLVFGGLLHQYSGLCTTNRCKVMIQVVESSDIDDDESEVKSTKTVSGALSATWKRRIARIL